MIHPLNRSSKSLLLTIAVFVLSIAMVADVQAQIEKAWEVSIPINQAKVGIDPSGYVYGTVNFWSSAENLNDIRVWKIDSNGQVVFNTTWHHQHENAYGILHDEVGNLHLIGTSNETNTIPSPAQQFSIVFDSNGTLVDEQFYANPPGYSFDNFSCASVNKNAGLTMAGHLYNATSCDNRCNSIYNFSYLFQSSPAELIFIKDDCVTQATHVTSSALSSAGDTYVSYYAYDPDECDDAECNYIYPCDITLNPRLLKITASGVMEWDIATDYNNSYIVVDNDDNLIRIATDPAVLDLNYIEKYNSSTGSQSWSVPTNYRVFRTVIDYDNNLIVHGNSGATKKVSSESEPLTYYIVKYDGFTGAELWRKTIDIYCTIGIGPDNQVYVGGYVPINYPDFDHFLRCYSSSGTELFSQYIGTGSDIASSIIGINDKGDIYAWSSNKIVKYATAQYLTVKDAHSNNLSNIAFDLIKITHSVPDLREDTLGSFTTDVLGRLEITPVGIDSFTVDLIDSTTHLYTGDILKISKHVHSVPAAKHEAVLGTAYSVHLDNAEFTEAGEIYFDTLGSGGSMDVTLRHTELRYNLLVSVEWQASEEYLFELMVNFENMSNYLYDVSDGQIRLDTVIIYDNFDFDSEADIHILADNYHNPDAIVGSFLLAVPPDSDGNNQLRMPRYWAGHPDWSRNWSTWGNYPIDLNSNSNDYRTKAHEFGHYVLGFYDEYLFWSDDSSKYANNPSLRCLPLDIFNYGFMDHQYQSFGTNSSEMSSSYRYEMASCQNTNQYGVLHQSCWDHLEGWVETTPWGPDNIFVPILKPHALDESERLVSNPNVVLTGPNGDLNNLDYDVANLMVFPVDLAPVPAGYSDKKFRFLVPGESPDMIEVTLSNNVGHPTDFRQIRQGMTADNGEIVVLGIKQPGSLAGGTKNSKIARVIPGRVSQDDNQVTSDWYYSRVALDTISADSVLVDLQPVYGSFPMIASAVLSQDDIQLDFVAGREFTQLPQAEHFPDSGGFESLTLSEAGSIYSTSMSNFSSLSGTVEFTAVDDSGFTFFVPFHYSYKQLDNNMWDDYFKITSPDNMVDMQLDTTTGISEAILLSSNYPEIRGDLDPNAVRVGVVASISVFPNNQFGPSNQITIHYSDADLKLGEDYLGNESSLQIYRWDGSSSWNSIGGYVNPEANSIIASITQSGVYAAFTTQIVTDVEENEYGEVLPYRIELSQNYPNPFNPVTTIEYSLPRRCHVTIEVYNLIGQKVQTLVDREDMAGSYKTTWDGTTASGQQAATGVYLYRFQTEDCVITKKMLLLK